MPDPKISEVTYGSCAFVGCYIDGPHEHGTSAGPVTESPLQADDCPKHGRDGCGWRDAARRLEGELAEIKSSMQYSRWEGQALQLEQAVRERDEANERSHKSWEAACHAEAQVEALSEQVAALNERDLRVTGERDELRAALRGLVRAMLEVSPAQKQAVRLLAEIAQREERAKDV